MMLRKLPFILLLFVAALPACTKVDMNFGGEIIDPNYTQIIKVDTFNVSMSTVYLDSFITSAKGVTLLGGYTDTAFGRIDTKCFFEVAPPAYTAVYDNTYYDSLSLILKVNHNYYGDTTKPIHIDISRVNQVIQPYQQNGLYLYNNQSFSVNPSFIGSADIMVFPYNRVDTISIRMDDNLGRQLMAKLQDATDFDMKNSTNFLNFFNGLMISSNSSSSAIFGFSDSVTMRLSYRKAGIFPNDTHVDFTLANKAHHFNNISVNRAGTPLQNLQTAREIPAVLTHNVSYSQPSSSAMIKVRFPNIRDLLNFPHYAKVLKAVLLVKPEAASFDRKLYLPPQLRLSTTNYLNLVGQDLTAISSTGSAAVQYGNLVLDYNSGNTYYTYDLSSYIKSIITDPNYNYTQSGLLLTPPSPAYETQFARLIAGSTLNPITNSQIQLQIYYATVQ